MSVDFSVITNIAVFLINAIGCWLIFLVYFSKTDKKIKTAFISMTTCMLIWVDFAYTARLPNQLELSLFWIKIAWAVTIPLFASLYFFAVYFVKEEKKHKVINIIVLFIGISSFIVTLSTDWIIKDIQSKQVWTKLIYGDKVIIFYGLVFFLSILALRLLLKKYFYSSRKEKRRTQYLLIGIIFFLFMNVVFNIIYPFFLGVSKYYQLGDYSTVVSMGFIAYAITRKELMGTKILITQTLIVIISLILLSDIILLSNDLTMQILKIGILISFLYFSRGMIESVKKEKKAKEKLENTYKEIDQYVKQLKKINKNLKEKNEDLGVLLDIDDIVTETLNSKKIAQNIVDSIPTNLKHLGYKGGILVLYDKKKAVVYTYALTESKIVKKAKKLLGKSLAEHKENIDEVDNLVMKTIKTKKMQTGNKLEEFIAPTVSKKICGLIQKLVGAKSFISVPIFSGGRIKGTIVFVGVKPKSKIVQRDKDILFGFSSHIGAAIENAQLYEQTEKQIKTLSVLNENLKMANIKLKGLMEMKTEFLHITSHQLRTPLTAIRGMISMWHDGDFNDLSKKEKKKMLKRIYISSERLNNITNDMLDSLELEGGFMKFQFKQMSLREVIKETVDIMKPNFDKKNLYLKFNNNANIPKVEVEPNYIRQVFINTIDNACKYTQKGGVAIDIKKVGKYVEVTIKDTGIGVSETYQKKIFQKFTRGKRASTENASGSGLGLFIAKKIVEAHNGKIEFSSKGTGKGSVVKVKLLVKQKG